MSRVIGKIGRIVFKRPAYFDRTINAYKLDAVYPFTQFIDNVELNCEIVYWIYDFQHKYLPGMFSKEEIEKRDLDFSNIAKYGKKVVVSSLDALNSFKTFYPKSNASLHLLPFISIIDEKKISDFNAVKREHKIERQFFLVANQFWQHKNHMIVFKAVKILKENFPGILVVVTGRKESYGQTSYLSSLVDYINKYALSENIIFTNFIPRNEQLSLMKNCIAIIQPSKFEGWSTVIEDAKALNKTVIASDINVHREQLGENSHFFAPDDETKLVLILTSILKDNKEVTLNVDYNYLYKIQGFADNFIKMFS
jgi:glycosyltransferase involved in cell wall biosynthesis